MKEKIKKLKNNAYVVSSFIFSLFFWIPLLNNFTSILAIVFGFAGLKELKINKNERGKAFALIGITIGFVTIIISIIGFILYPALYFGLDVNATR